jgi:WD40 repeat protein
VTRLPRSIRLGAWVAAVFAGVVGLVAAWNEPPRPRAVLPGSRDCELVGITTGGHSVVALAHDRKSVLVWDTDSGRLSHEIPVPESAVSIGLLGMVFLSADGESLAILTADGARLARTRADGFRDVTGTSLGRDGWAEFSPDLRFLAAMPSPEEGPDVITVLDLTDGRVVARIRQRASILFAPDGRTLATFNDDGLRLWESVGGREMLRADGTVFEAQFSPDGRLLAACLGVSPDAPRAHGGSVYVWATETGLRRWQLPGVHGPDLALSPDGRWLATSSPIHVNGLERWGGFPVRLWDMEERRLVAELPAFADDGECPFPKPFFSPDGLFLGCVFDGGYHHLWDLRRSPPTPHAYFSADTVYGADDECRVDLTHFQHEYPQFCNNRFGRNAARQISPVGGRLFVSGNPPQRRRGLFRHIAGWLPSRPRQDPPVVAIKLIDLLSLREVASWQGEHQPRLLSADGRVLVTDRTSNALRDFPNKICVWDLPPPKPWPTILVWSAFLLALLAVGLRRWRRSRPDLGRPGGYNPPREPEVRR